MKRDPLFLTLLESAKTLVAGIFLLFQKLAE